MPDELHTPSHRYYQRQNHVMLTRDSFSRDTIFDAAIQIIDGFSPAALFAAGEAGFWGEVTTADLWQDTARTTPVTAAGQAVASWRLRTASGVIYAEQATAGNRPLYQLDGSRGFLEFDGATSNRWLQTPAVNFSASDEVTVVAGFRKLSDAARATVVELTNAATGRFTIEAPSAAATANLIFLSSGTTPAASASSNVYPAPFSAVLTGLGKISTDTSILRVNGAQINSVATDQGTGNFSNAIVYIGRRGGASQPFSGRLYGLIARGALTSGAQLTAVERWMNERTGAF